MWKGSLHIKRRTSNDAKVGGKKRREQNGQKSASKKRERRAFIWLVRASFSFGNKNKGMSVVDGWFGCEPYANFCQKQSMTSRWRAILPC